MAILLLRSIMVDLRNAARTSTQRAADAVRVSGDYRGRCGRRSSQLALNNASSTKLGEARDETVEDKTMSVGGHPLAEGTGAGGQRRPAVGPEPYINRKRRAPATCD
jgi:hypothetical protein